MKLSFENRIPRWDEGLPLGNGILGALVWGEADDFRISLNRADLWDLRRSDTFSSPQFNYREYVRLARAGKAGMGEFASLFDAPYNLPFPTRIPAAALRVLSDGDGGTGEFSLDVSRAEATVRTSSAEVRVFTDAAEKYGRILVSGSCRVQLLPPSFAETAEKSEVVRHPLSSLGYPPCKRFAKNGGEWFVQEISGGRAYAAFLCKKITGDGAEYVFDVRSLMRGEEEAEEHFFRLLKTLKTPYVTAIRPHAGWWKKFFSESRVSLPQEEKNLARLHELGEYFLACCSRKNCPPMTLQGVWLADDGDLPPWKGDYHLDLNLQYSYASAFKFNHLEQGECYTDFLLSLRPAAKKFAKDFFGADGYILPGVMDIEGNPMAGWGQYSLSPGNHPWNCLGLDECQ